MSCQDGRLPYGLQVQNMIMALPDLLGFISGIQASISSGQEWKEIRYTAVNGSPGKVAQEAWWAYGIDSLLVRIQYVCMGSGVGISVKKRVPAKMHWMADHLLRQYAEATHAVIVESPPVYRGNYPSDRNITGKMWKPRGVPAKPKSLQGRLARAIGAAGGYTMDRAYENLNRYRQEALERQGQAGPVKSGKIDRFWNWLGG